MKIASVRLYVLVQLAAIFLMTGVMRAQASGTGAIAGTVHDPSGLVVANAAVSVVNEATNVTRTATTNSTGVFTMTLLVPGNYSVTVSNPGFAENTAKSIRVVVGETSSLEFKLAIKTVSVAIDVAADTEIVQAQSSTLGRAVQEEAVQDLPLENRNFTQILSLSPGVVVGLPNAAALGRGSQNVSADGGKNTANDVQFNGVDAVNQSQNSVENATEEVGVAIPAPDTIVEFKVQTANYDASYGHGAGANVDVITRAGTNKFHGGAWEFLRNNVLNGNDFFLKAHGQPRPELKQNQFGGRLGGPIWRDKTFFFGAYQGLRSVNGFGSKTTATLPQLTADRSAATLGAQFCPANHPGAGFQTFAGGTQVACNGSNINPVALALLNFKFPNGQYAIPAPQVNSAIVAGQIPTGQSTFAPPATYNEDQYTLNLDQILSSTNQLSARSFYSTAPTAEPFSPSAATVPGWGTNELDQNAMLVLADTQQLSSTLVDVARFGYMRFAGASTVTAPISSAAVGTVSPTGATGTANAPSMTIDGLFTIGDASTPQQSQVTNSYIYQDTVAWTRNRQTMSAGVEVKRHQVEINPPFASDGLMDIRTFEDFLVGQSAAQNGSPTGISNVTTSVGSSGLFRRHERYTDFAGFVQDDIKVSQRLTVNAGLRYEIFGPPSEIDGRLLTFDPSAALAVAPVGGTLSGFVVPANLPGTLPPGVVRSSHNGLWSTTYNDISPRFGFALRLTDKPTILLRGGYGIYFDQLSAGMVEGTLGQQPFALRQQMSNAQNGAATLQQPFNPLLPLNSSYPLFQPRVPGGALSINGNSTHMGTPYTQEYNLNLQYALGRDFLVETGYVGTRTLHVPGSTMFNQAQLASPTNPINGVTTNTVANVAQRLPFTGASATSLFNDTRYISNYNSLQTSVTKRMSHGLEFLGSYTWSKNLDETSGSNGGDFYELWLTTNNQLTPSGSYGLTDFDRTNRGVLSVIYRTPTTSWSSRVAREAFGGWEASGIFVAQSGTPITILDSGAGQVYGTLQQEHRAQLSGSPIPTTGSLFSRVQSGYINRAAFTSAPEAPFGGSAADTDFGNSGVGIVRGPGQSRLDTAIERTFSLEGKGNLLFRTEFFNVTNTPVFANPNRTFSSGATFGTITTTNGNPRIIQFAAKYEF